MSQKSILRGTRLSRVADARQVGRSDPQATIQVGILIRRNPSPPPALVAKANAIPNQPIGARTYLTVDEFDQVYGAAPDDLSAVADFLTSAGIQVIDSSVPMRRIVVEATIGALEQAFEVELYDYQHDQLGPFRGRDGHLMVPIDLAAIIVTVEGLDTRPAVQARTARQPLAPRALLNGAETNILESWPDTFFPPQVASLYQYPGQTDGAGENLAVFAFNGGNAPDPRGGYRIEALNHYYVNILGQSMPSITDVVVMGPGNVPGPGTQASSDQGDSTQEVMLDLCVTGSVAPGAKIFVYFTEFTSFGWTEAIYKAITDNNGISVISISYGNPEDGPNTAWTPAAISVVNDAFQAAASRGITICCAAGDHGSSDSVVPTGAHADFPASSPWVLGVGGTRLTATQGPTPVIASEVVWNDLPSSAGGGGVSAIFGLPDYQEGAGVPPSVNVPHLIGRGVPDVAALADPNTGVIITVDGQNYFPIGGTSAAAPMWASLVVRLNQALGTRVGYLNPTLYKSCASGVLNDITIGNNGAYAARVGWDACTGLGSPNGERLLQALRTVSHT